MSRLCLPGAVLPANTTAEAIYRLVARRLVVCATQLPARALQAPHGSVNDTKLEFKPVLRFCELGTVL